MLSSGVSSFLSTVASQTIDRQGKQCNFSKRKQTPIDRIFITLMFPYHSRGLSRTALMNDTLMLPSLLLVSAPHSRVLSPWWCGSAGTSARTGTWFSSMPRPQSTAVTFVIADFKRCRGFAGGGGGQRSTGRHDLSRSCTLLNHPTLCSPTWRVGVKLLTCDMWQQC